MSGIGLLCAPMPREAKTANRLTILVDAFGKPSALVSIPKAVKRWLMGGR